VAARTPEHGVEILFEHAAMADQVQRRGAYTGETFNDKSIGV
jgi:hypothetical protein